MSSGEAAPLFRRVLNGWVFFLAVVLSRLLEVPLLPWHLWPGWRRWHPRIGGGPCQRLATRRCHAASAGCRGAGHRQHLQKAKQKRSAASPGRSHTAEFIGRKKTERARPRMLLRGGQGHLGRSSQPSRAPGCWRRWACLRPGLAGQEGIVLCQQFDRTILGLTAEAPERGRGGREWVHRVSILEVGSPCSLVELDA